MKHFWNCWNEYSTPCGNSRCCFPNLVIHCHRTWPSPIKNGINNTKMSENSCRGAPKYKRYIHDSQKHTKKIMFLRVHKFSNLFKLFQTFSNVWNTKTAQPFSVFEVFSLCQTPKASVVLSLLSAQAHLTSYLLRSSSVLRGQPFESLCVSWQKPKKPLPKQRSRLQPLARRT